MEPPFIDRNSGRNETAQNNELHGRRLAAFAQMDSQLSVPREFRGSVTEENAMHRQLAAAILFAVATMPSGTAYAQDSENEFPAKLTVVSQHVDDVGRRHVRVRLIVDDDVAVYAHQLGFAGMEHASAKLTVFDADRKPLRVKVTYPQGEKLETEFFGVWYLYRDAVDMKVVVPANSSLPLILRCRVAGYNEQGSYCLGFGWLETKIAANQRRTEQGDEPKSR